MPNTTGYNQDELDDYLDALSTDPANVSAADSAFLRSLSSRTQSTTEKGNTNADSFRVPHRPRAWHM